MIPRGRPAGYFPEKERVYACGQLRYRPTQERARYADQDGLGSIR